MELLTGSPLWFLSSLLEPVAHSGMPCSALVKWGWCLVLPSVPGFVDSPWEALFFLGVDGGQGGVAGGERRGRRGKRGNCVWFVK